MTATNRQEQPQRLVVYTVLFGGKEALGSPLSELGANDWTDLDIEFICFTDNRDLVSDTWRFVYIEDVCLPPEKLSRRPKALAYEYLSGWTYSLYIDNIVTFKRLPNSADLATGNPYLFKVYRHAYREHLLQEADAIAMLGYDDVNTIGAQLDFYASILPLDSIRPIHTCTVILREHHHPAVKRHGVTWWENILCFSKRDQMSFDFAVKQSGCLIDPLPGFKHDNDFINGTLNAGDNRVKANFDEIKYAWRHRYCPEARENPKAHFLANESAAGDAYAKRTQLFEHVCRRYQSSLGRAVAPRRAVTGALEDLFNRYRQSGGRMLVVRIRDEANELGFSADEFDAAARSISVMLNQYAIGTLELDAKDLCLSNGVFNRTADLFDIVILLGLPPKDMRSVFGKFVGLLNPVRGMLTILGDGSLDLDLVSDARRRMAERFARSCDVAISFSRHDSLDKPIPNSLICLEWA